MNSVAENLVFDPQIIRRFDINGPMVAQPNT